MYDNLVYWENNLNVIWTKTSKMEKHKKNFQNVGRNSLHICMSIKRSPQNLLWYVEIYIPWNYIYKIPSMSIYVPHIAIHTYPIKYLQTKLTNYICKRFSMFVYKSFSMVFSHPCPHFSVNILFYMSTIFRPHFLCPYTFLYNC